MSNTPSNFHVLTNRDLLLALLFFALTLLLGSFQMVEGVTGVYHDDGIYLSTAKALSEGQGYRLINLPDAPAQTKYPPLYPMLLALIWIIYPLFPGNLVLMQWVTLICGGVFVGLTYLYLVRFNYSSRSVAAASAVLTLSATQFLYFSTQILSEIPFALLAIIALWALEKQEECFFKARIKQLLLGGLLCLPFFTRIIGIIFLPLAFFRIRLKKKPLGWIIFGSLIFLLPWAIWIWVSFQGNSNDSSDIYYVNYITWWQTYLKSAFSDVVLLNLLYITVSTVSFGIGLLNTNLFFPIWGWPFVALAGLIVWVFIFVDIFRGRILPVFLFCYLIIILVWPWRPFRFLIPILPFLIIYFLNIFERLLIKTSLRMNPQKLFWLVIVPIFFSNLILVSNTVLVSRGMNYPKMISMEEPITWKSYEDLFQWIENHTLENDIIASGFDTMIYIYTGRQGFRPFIANPIVMIYGKKDASPLGSEEEIMQIIQIKNAGYLVQMPMPGFLEEKYLSDAITEIKKKYPGFLDEVYRGDDERFVVYQIRTSEQIENFTIN